MGKIWDFPLIYFKGYFRGSRIAKLLLPPELHHVAKFQKCPLSNTNKPGEGKNKKKTEIKSTNGLLSPSS